ncbi:unnamed protein product [Ambrosiozyma monospora]|uniref:ubiquitinyl hydrolase 1 n=1 Tax=Ambrosiozyma monospora TaxID=43982 RepID=A0A9W6WCP5_AMBMO|nr:unnamed protein product [Ambrosiozyma monospora]
MVLCKVSWVGQGICREQKHDFLVPKTSTVNHLIDRLESKGVVKIDERDELLCWTFDMSYKVPRICNLDYIVGHSTHFVIGNYPNIKEALLERPANIRLIPCIQFFTGLQNVHSIPFIFDLVDGEKFKDTKVRLHKVLGMSEKEFQSARIALTDLKRVEYLDAENTDNYVLFSIVKDNLYLGIDHPNRNTRRGTINEPSIFIKG